MKTLYLWINDFVDNKEEIEQQLFFENQQEKIFKVVLVYEEEFVWEMLVHHFMDAVAIFGGDDTNLGSSLFQGFQHCNGFGEELGIGGHMYVRFFHIFFFIGDECIFVGDAGQDAE